MQLSIHIVKLNVQHAIIKDAYIFINLTLVCAVASAAGEHHRGDDGIQVPAVTVLCVIQRVHAAQDSA